MAGKIFINYRRDDSGGTAGRLHDRLAQTFGRKNLFMDVDHIPAGVDFVDYLPSQVAACDVFLAVIGPNWLDAKDDDGRRRFDSPHDFVTIEIAAALARNIRPPQRGGGAERKLRPRSAHERDATDGFSYFKGGDLGEAERPRVRSGAASMARFARTRRRSSTYRGISTAKD